ncbi:hypothetical protein A8V34_00085 [Rickettsia sp. wq]|nr:hypothetical protein A8V34_00085 [Rickettsia sp. wq]
MLNQVSQKIKLFEHQFNHQTTLNNKKPPYPTDGSSYLAPLYGANSALIDSYIQLVTYFV